MIQNSFALLAICFWSLFAQGLTVAQTPSQNGSPGLVLDGEASEEKGSAKRLLSDQLIHLRPDGEREWSSFADQPAARSLDLAFEAEANKTELTLSLRQQDVKQAWQLSLNDRKLGQLVRDENDLRCDFDVPIGALVDGVNRLTIQQVPKTEPDDVLVGEILLHAEPRDDLRRGAFVEVVITDVDDNPMPGRITVVDAAGTLVPLGASSGAGQAVREGVIYTSSGKVRFGLKPGSYRLFAGRGFEYAVESAELQLARGDSAKRTFQLSRQVDTSGWVACDTHVHTVTHSGHGDCTILERMATIAGEGIELPIATDHNKQISYDESSKEAGTTSYFTPVVGNEVTTRSGHFNVFPAVAGGTPPDHNADDWAHLFDSIFGSPSVAVAILNHGRDLHSGFRPFSPRHHLSLVGENLDGWDRRFNAMELINSGAVQTDPMQLFGDWCGLINHGLSVTPVGSSDSHDVSRFIVGQGRTYIECDDSEPGDIDIEAAVNAFRQGRVVVSYGLFAHLKANRDRGPGELVSLGQREDLDLSIQILGPKWVELERVELWVNGEKRREQHFGETKSSLKASIDWEIPRSELSHDSWLSVVAVGPGVKGPFWPFAKPYQPDSIFFESSLFSCTGALRVDVDGDGVYQSPRETAERILVEHGFAAEPAKGDWRALADDLARCDRAVVLQTLSLLRMRSYEPAPLWDSGGDTLRSTMSLFDRSWRRSVRARLEQAE